MNRWIDISRADKVVSEHLNLHTFVFYIKMLVSMMNEWVDGYVIVCICVELHVCSGYFVCLPFQFLRHIY